MAVEEEPEDLAVSSYLDQLGEVSSDDDDDKGADIEMQKRDEERQAARA